MRSHPGEADLTRMSVRNKRRRTATSRRPRRAFLLNMGRRATVL
jgi:hypothetical protein